ncbi:hypothetical protein DVH05_005267 [Phytophthora capsici]|nr:hypothetical protein DVH05_005267 [Phytophthora capsici]
MVGRLARHRQLNVTMDVALWIVSKSSTACYAVDSVSTTNEKPFIPDYALSGCKFVLVPVHMKALKHWMIQIVEIKMTDADTTKHKIWATFYDPLGVGSNLDICESKRISFTLPLLQSWFKRDMDREKLRNLIPKNRLKRSASAARSRESGDDTPEMQFPDVLAVRMTRPTQVDDVSCGILCAAQAYSYVTGSRSLNASKRVSKNDLELIRLRLLWATLHEAVAPNEKEDAELWMQMLEIRKLVKKAFSST